MKKICFVTAARSEYGLLRWLMEEVDSSDEFELQIIATGGHLLKEQGYTVSQIQQDGFRVDLEVDAKLEFETKKEIAASMGRMAEGMAHAFEKLQPDYLVVLGDRCELLPICSSALVMNIPIVHISGGDVTEGAIDNEIRNAVTMLASYHFPGTADSYANICRMRGSDKNVWAVGETSIDAFRRETFAGREELSKIIGIDANKRWVLMTYHPETKASLDYNLAAVKNCCDVLSKLTDTQIIVTFANADFGGKHINAYLKEREREEKNRYKVLPSLGNTVYLGLMSCVDFIIGNSSSGIVEAPYLKKPVINIGNRQKGRHLCKNIIQSDITYESICESINKALQLDCAFSDSEYWGDGYASERICGILKKIAAGDNFQ